MNDLLQRLRDREAHTHNMQYQETYPTIKLCEEAANEIEKLRAVLVMMYDKWENGDGCFDESGVFLGNAFRLTQAEEDQVLSLIPAERDK